MNAALSSDNPYNGQHVQQFCEYADAVADGAAEEVKRDIVRGKNQRFSRDYFILSIICGRRLALGAYYLLYVL